MKRILICAALLLPGLVQAQFVLTKVADTSTPIPNGSGNFSGFTSLSGPAMSPGSVAFYATGAGGQKGYYVQTNGVLFRAVDTNTVAPGGGNFTSVSPFAYGLEADSLYFGGNTATEAAMFVYSNGVITKLVGTNTTIPGVINKFSAELLLYPYDGRVAFHGQGANSSQVGIYRYDGGVVSKIADTNDNFTGGSGKLSFTTSSAEVSHDANGVVAFFTFDSTLATRKGIFTATTNSLVRIASTDTLVPGRAIPFSGSNPIFSRKPDLSAGKVVFSGRFSGGSGIYEVSTDGNVAFMIADTSTLIPGTAGNFSSFAEQAIELGTVVFTAQGSGIYGAYRYQNGVLDKIIAKPDTLSGKTVATVVLGNQGLNGGRVALQITFSDGSSGIYTTIVGYANQTAPGGTLVPGTLLYSAVSGFSFQFTGEIGRAYRVQSNTNLSTTNWITLTNFTYAAPLTITDGTAAGTASRVYRAISP